MRWAGKRIHEGHEVVSELMEAEILRTRKGGGQRQLPAGVISRNLSSIARLASPKAARSIKAFVNAVRTFWGRTFARAHEIRKGLKEGKIDQAQYDAFVSKILGLKQQDKIGSEVMRTNQERFTKTETQPMAPAASFSLSPVKVSGDMLPEAGADLRNRLRQIMGATVQNAYTGWDIGTSTPGLAHVVNQNKGESRIVLPHLKELVEQAIWMGRRRHRDADKERGIRWQHLFYAPYNTDNHGGVVRFVVNETWQGERLWDAKTSEAKKVPDGSRAAVQPIDSADSSIPPSGRITVRQLSNLVKELWPEDQATLSQPVNDRRAMLERERLEQEEARKEKNDGNSEADMINLGPSFSITHAEAIQLRTKIESQVPIESSTVNLPELRTVAAIKQWANDNGIYGTTSHPQIGGEVQIVLSTLKSEIAHRFSPKKAASLAVMKELIPVATYLESRMRRTNVLSHRLAGVVNVGGHPYVARIVIDESRNGTLVYNHELSDLKELQETKRPQPLQSAGALEQRNGWQEFEDTGSLLRWIYSVKEEEEGSDASSTDTDSFPSGKALSIGRGPIPGEHIESGIEEKDTNTEPSSSAFSIRNHPFQWSNEEERQKTEDRAFEQAKQTRIVNTDDIRPLLPGYEETDPLIRDTQFHQAASGLNMRVIGRMLAEPLVTRVVDILAGGGGSGKTTAAENFVSQKSDFIVDTTLSNPEAAIRLIDAIRASGREAQIIYVHSPFEKAFSNIVKRFIFGKSQGSPRLVPLDVAIKAHIGAQETIFKLKGVKMMILDNSGKIEDVHEISLEDLRSKKYLTSNEKGDRLENRGRGHRGLEEGTQRGAGKNGQVLGRAEAEARLRAEGERILRERKEEGLLTEEEFDAFLGRGRFSPEPLKDAGKSDATHSSEQNSGEGDLGTANAQPAEAAALDTQHERDSDMPKQNRDRTLENTFDEFSAILRPDETSEEDEGLKDYADYFREFEAQVKLRGLLYDGLQPMRPGGREHDITYDPDTRTALKFTKPSAARYVVNFDFGYPTLEPGLPLEYLERQLLHNEIFDDDITFVGLGGESIRRRIITRQRFLEGDAADWDQITRLMVEDLGFTKLPHNYGIGHEDSHAFIRGDVAVFDLRPPNVIQTTDGEIVPIDCIPVRLTPETRKLLIK